MIKKNNFDGLFPRFLDAFPELKKNWQNHCVTVVWNELHSGQNLLSKKHIYLKDSVLYVKINNPAQRMEMNLNKEQVLQKIQEKIGKELVAKIVFR